MLLLKVDAVAELLVGLGITKILLFLIKVALQGEGRLGNAERLGHEVKWPLLMVASKVD